MCSFISSKYKIIQLRVQWANFMTPSYFQISRDHLFLSVLCSMQCSHCIFYHRVHFWSVTRTQGRMQRVIISKHKQPLKVRPFHKQQGQPTWIQTRQETFEMPQKRLKTRLWDLTSQPARSYCWYYDQISMVISGITFLFNLWFTNKHLILGW